MSIFEAAIRFALLKPGPGPMRVLRRHLRSGALAAVSALPAPAAADPPRPIPEPIYGVTVDSVDNLQDIVAALRNLPRKPTTRIVFDEYRPPRTYAEAVGRIGQVSFIMGEILDSQAVRLYTPIQYANRTARYLKAFGNQVDIWEIGNEVNGEWLGNTGGVVRKLAAAYHRVKAKGYRTALTLYYNEGCWENPKHEMFTWAEKNIPKPLKMGLDYVLVSYYEEDCNHLRPDWNAVFSRLATLFPNSKIGFGEVGTTVKAAKADYLSRYYSLRIDQPRYIGGYFWWYFSEDMVPMTQPLWQTLYDAIR